MSQGANTVKTCKPLPFLYLCHLYLRLCCHLLCSVCPTRHFFCVYTETVLTRFLQLLLKELVLNSQETAEVPLLARDQRPCRDQRLGNHGVKNCLPHCPPRRVPYNYRFVSYSKYTQIRLFQGTGVKKCSPNSVLKVS